MGNDIYILGAGGHAKVLIATLKANGYRVTAVYDDDRKLQGSVILDVPVMGRISDLSPDFQKPAVIGIGDNHIRQTIARRFLQCPWVSVIHPGATVAESAKIGAGPVVFAGAVVQCDAEIGDHSIINTSATVDHDCRIGDFSHIAPGAHLAGQVTIGNGVMAGIGCTVIQNLHIGDWTTIGAGAAVIRDLSANITAVGVPAKPIRHH